MIHAKYLNTAERESLKALCLRNLTTDRRNAVMLIVALECGLRAQELLNLTHEDLDFETRCIKVKTLKKGRPRTIPAPRCLFDYAASQEQRVNVFGIGYQRLVQVWHAYRPVKKPFHSLRHTFAIGLYSRRKDINLVKHVLGHKSLSSTTVYLDESYDLTTLRQSMGVK